MTYNVHSYIIGSEAKQKGCDFTIRRYDSQAAKRRVLAASALLFLENGYTNTRMADILREANISAGSFQNIFRTKDGVLKEFIAIMFNGQFDMTRKMAAGAPTPVYIYAVETALQLTLTEMNEKLRDIYIEAYTYPDTVEIIHRSTAKELQHAFSVYLPDCDESFFYETDLGTAGMMRAFMAHRCDPYFTLERKIRRFLEMSLSIFHVPEAEQTQIIDYALGLNLSSLANEIMDSLFQSLSIRFDLNRKPQEQKD